MRAYCRKAWGFNSPSLHFLSILLNQHDTLSNASQFELVLRDDPEDDEARLLLAVVYNNKADAAYDKGDWASALASVERAIALNPKKLYLHNKAVVLYQMGRHREALRYVRRARRSPPDPIEIVDGWSE